MDNLLYFKFTSMFYTVILGYLTDSLLKRYIKPDAVYFLLHVLLNTYIVLLTYNNFITFMLNPFVSFQEYDYISIKSSSVIIGFHIYHYIAEILDFETKIHHIVTVFLTGIASILVPTGITVGAINFIMCGLPGGIDYILLVLLKYNIINKLTEKNINRWLNLLIRMPGMMLFTWYVVLNIYHYKINLYTYIYTVIGCVLMLINSIYYCNKTLGNYHIRFYEYNKYKKDKIKQKILNFQKNGVL